MQFIRAEKWQVAARALSSRLQQTLEQGPVLWLVSGGSNIAASVEAMQRLPEDLTEKLAISLIDERYGLPGHKDSNYKQILDAGFQAKQATFMPVLIEGLTAKETAHRYGEMLERSLGHAKTIIGQLGIGHDGHIAGIFPHSPAVTANGLVAVYDTEPYTRITATFAAIERISVEYTLAFGENKRITLHKLLAENLNLAEQPAQILKHLPEVYIYNDLIGDTE